MIFGKHTEEGQAIRNLQNAIKLKEKEIKDIKVECAEQFKNIKDLCFINDYGDKYLSLKKIYEIASDNFSALVKDLAIEEQKENAKIIELPTTVQSRK